MTHQPPLNIMLNDYTKPAPTRRRICDLPREEQPLYRLQHHGSDALATSELLALILGTTNGLRVADNLLTTFGSLHALTTASEAQLRRFHGIGRAQAARLLAILTLSRRLQMPVTTDALHIRSPADAANLLMPQMRHLQQEELWVLLLDTRNRVLSSHVVYKGSLNSSVVRIGELFRPAIEAPAAALIVAHNHPSGDPSPSPEDIRVTREIVKAGKLLAIDVLDHLIIGHNRFASLKERNLGFD